MEFFMRMILILGVMVLGFTACSNKKTVDTNPVVRDKECSRGNDAFGAGG